MAIDFSGINPSAQQQTQAQTAYPNAIGSIAGLGASSANSVGAASPNGTPAPIANMASAEGQLPQGDPSAAGFKYINVPSNFGQQGVWMSPSQAADQMRLMNWGVGTM